MRLTLCDTRDFLSATVRPEFASTAWKTRPCVEMVTSVRNGSDITAASEDDLQMHQSQELGRGGSSWGLNGMGFQWLENEHLVPRLPGAL